MVHTAQGLISNLLRSLGLICDVRPAFTLICLTGINSRGFRSQTSRNGREMTTKQDVILVSRNQQLTAELGSRLQAVPLTNITNIPEDLRLRCIIFDADFVRVVDLSWIRRAYPTAFIAVLDPSASENPAWRLNCFNAGANMVAHDISSLVKTITECVLHAGSNGGRLTCPYCQLTNLHEDELWRHVPAYHVNWPAEVPILNPECPICNKRPSCLPVHIHEDHGPIARLYRKQHRSSAEKLFTQLYNFSLVVCRHPLTGKFLLCQEFSNQGFWLPGGAVDGGETLTSAAVRETMEEAGIDVDLKGILAMEYNPCGQLSRDNSDYLVRLRVVFYAEPTLACIHMFPKSCPDFESAGAAWCTIEQLSQIKLRGSEPLVWAHYLRDGGVIYPMDLLKERVG